MSRVTVTGGAGYVGALVVDELLAGGHDVRVLDVLLHGQEELRAHAARSAASSPDRGRHPRRRRPRAGAARASTRSSTSPRSSGDPACARDPELSHAVNVEGTQRARRGRRAARRAAPRVRLHLLQLRPHGRSHGARSTRRASSRPVSLYAEQKVGIEQALLDERPRATSRPPACASPPSTASRRGCASTSPSTSSPATCGRTATSRSSASSSGAPTSTCATPRAPSARCSRRRPRRVAGEVFNVGRSDENYRKLDLVERHPEQLDRGEVSYVHRDEDPRDYKVSFDKVDASARLRAAHDGARRRRRDHRRARRRALRRPVRRRPHCDDPGRPIDPDQPTSWSRCSTCACATRTSRRSSGRCASGWLTHGPADRRRSRRRSPRHLGVPPRRRGLELHRRAAPGLPGRRGRARATR